MKKVSLFILALCPLFLAACSSGDKITYDPETAVLLHNATVFDAKSGTMIPSQDVLIDGEKIIAVKQGKGKAKAAEWIDCTGKYVIPGLCDSHTHLAFLTTLGGDSVRTELEDFVRRGVLYVRDVGGPIGVMSELKNKIASGELTGPDIFYTGPMLESSPLTWEEFNKDLPGFTVALDTRDDVDRVLPELAREVRGQRPQDVARGGLEQQAGAGDPRLDPGRQLPLLQRPLPVPEERLQPGPGGGGRPGSRTPGDHRARNDRAVARPPGADVLLRPLLQPRLPELPGRIRDRARRRLALAQRALESLEAFRGTLDAGGASGPEAAASAG